MPIRILHADNTVAPSAFEHPVSLAKKAVLRLQRVIELQLLLDLHQLLPSLLRGLEISTLGAHLVLSLLKLGNGARFEVIHVALSFGFIMQLRSVNSLFEGGDEVPLLQRVGSIVDVHVGLLCYVVSVHAHEGNRGTNHARTHGECFLLRSRVLTSEQRGSLRAC